MPVAIEHRIAQSTSSRRLAIPLLIGAVRIAPMVLSLGQMPLGVALVLDALVFVTGWWAMAPLRNAYGDDLRNRSNPWGLLYVPWALGGILLLRDIVPLLR